MFLVCQFKFCFSFPPSSHPVLALKGAPASFPVSKRNRHLQKYLVWSDALMSEALDYISNTMNNDTFIAVHLRIGSDWVRLPNTDQDYFGVVIVTEH